MSAASSSHYLGNRVTNCTMLTSNAAHALGVNPSNTGKTMKALGLIGFCIFLGACASSTSIEPQQREASKPLTDSEKTYISQVETDGRLLYEKDIRSATATDLLLSKIDPADYPNFVGSVTYPNAVDFTVSFYEKSGEDFKVIADVDFGLKGSPTIDMNPSRAMTATERSMIQARIVGFRHGMNSCSSGFNTVVIPSQNKAAWDVYVLAGTLGPNMVQVGPHVKVKISKATGEVMERLILSPCLALDKPEDNLPEGASNSALTVSHNVTPMPVAIHPYLNLLHNISLAVSSERGLWMIESGSIRMLR